MGEEVGDFKGTGTVVYSQYGSVGKAVSITSTIAGWRAPVKTGKEKASRCPLSIQCSACSNWE